MKRSIWLRLAPYLFTLEEGDKHMFFHGEHVVLDPLDDWLISIDDKIKNRV